MTWVAFSSLLTNDEVDTARYASPVPGDNRLAHSACHT
jgi:hypothetical protein